MSKNTGLTRLEAYNNQLTNLDVSKNTTLTKLDLSNNQLVSLDVSNNSKLEYLSVSENQLTSIDVSNNPKLNWLTADKNKLILISASKSLELISLRVANNQLTSIDVSNNPKLEYLSVYNNQLTELDVSNKPKLESLDVSGNQLTELDVSKNTLLKDLHVRSNQVTTINLSNNIALETLMLDHNQLTSLDVSKNTALNLLWVGDNQLTELDVSNNTKLEDLDVYNNQLTELDVSYNLSLESLAAADNNFVDETYLYKGSSETGVNKVKTASGSKWENPTWKSSNANIVTVDSNGLITSLKAGNAVIIGDLFDNYQHVYTTANNVHVIELTSNKYMIDEDNSIIFVDNDSDSDIISSNINASDSDVTLDIDLDNKKLTLKHEDEVIKEFNLIIMTSDKYKIYDNDIVLYNDMDINNIKNSININSNDIDLIIDNNKLILKYNDEVLKEYDIVSYSSNKYDLSKDSIILNGEGNIDLDSINTINCTKEVINDKLVIKYNGEVIKEFNIIKGIKFGKLKVNNHNIVLDKEVETSYREFVSNISTKEGYSYKIYNKDEEIDENNNIIGGMVLKVYYNEEEVDSYNITYDYLEFDKELDIVEDIKLINNIIVGSTIESIKNGIKTSGNISVVDKNNNVISNLDNKIKTGDKFKIDVYGSILEYTASVKGDSTGDGEIDVMDIIDIVDTIIDNKEIEKAYYNASDYNNDNTIDVMDIIDIVDYIVK